MIRSFPHSWFGLASAFLACAFAAGGCYIYPHDDPGAQAPPPAPGRSTWGGPGWGAAPDAQPPPSSPSPSLPSGWAQPDAGADGAANDTQGPPAVGICPGVAVDRWRSLLVIDPNVIGSLRARNDSPAGIWSFRAQLERLAGSPEAAPDLAQVWLDHWRFSDSVAVTPGEAHAPRVAVTPRPSVNEVLLCPWLSLDPANRCSTGCITCDNRRVPLEQAPFRLLAIVNRSDLARGTACDRDGGELRFIYTAVNPRTQQALPFTVIFEYRVTLPAGQGRRDWAAAWRALGQYPFGPAYQAELEAVVGQGLRHSSLHRVRTNEVALGEPLGQPWEMRQFAPVVITGAYGGSTLQPIAVAHTPRLELDGTAELGQWLASNAAAILAGDNLLSPPMLAGAAAIPRPDFRWSAPGAEAQVLEAFNRNSCSGCHGGSQPPDLAFQHVGAPTELPYPGVAAGPVRVSRFLHDPAGASDELARRARLLEATACETCATPYPTR